MEHAQVILPERAEIRALAECNFKALQEVAAAGGNPHQVAIDQSDSVQAMAAAMSDSDATTFLTMYAAELDACARHGEAKRAEAVGRSAKDAANAQIIVGLIFFFSFLMLMVGIFKH